MTCDDEVYLSEVLRARGFRLTEQRKIIYEILCASYQHISLPEIYNQARQKTSGLNLVTVYRILDFLCELRLVVAADIGGGKWVYEKAGRVPHHHLVCRTCGYVQTFEHQVVSGFLDQLLADHQFLVDMDHITLFGLCKHCQSSGENS
jgi:Fur family ferric uptake transcriptional regulator